MTNVVALLSKIINTFQTLRQELSDPMEGGDQEAEITAAIMDRGGRVPEGYVFRISDGRIFFAPVGESSCELDLKGIEQLHNPHPDVVRARDAANRYINIQPFSKLRLGLDPMPANDAVITALIVKTYYGRSTASRKLAELSLA